MDALIETKTCTRCGETKARDEFYTRSGTDQPNSHCKQCMKEYARAQPHTAASRNVSAVRSEQDVIDILARVGVPALPGKALSQKWVDVVAWGCVHIEVKRAKPQVGNRYTWRLTPKQKAGGLHGDLIVLIKDAPSGPTYHIYRADDPIFFRGETRRETIPYVCNASHHKFGFREGVALQPITDEDIDHAQDRWYLVEIVRRAKSAALRGSEGIGST